MADYNHGVYGTMQDAVIANADNTSTAVVAIGTLPVHLLPDYDGMVGVPLVVSDSTAKDAYGYSENFASFTLCEVMQAFLGNSTGNIGGLYLINVLDPDTHRASSDTEASITFANGIGTLVDDLAIVSTIEVADETDVTAEYDWTTGTITISAGDASGAKTVTYKRVTPSAVTATQVVAGVSAVDDIYPLHGVIPDILIAPGWSDNPAVYQALITEAQGVDGHFLGFVLADIPTSAATVEAAIAWKASNGYTSKHSKACWPCVNDANGKVYHLSTIFAREMAREDSQNGGIPYATASNIVIAESGVCLADGSQVKIYNEQGNDLNAYGISTAKAWGGEVRLWGGHTAGYIFGTTKSGDSSIFDTCIRMLCYLVNSFQLRWVDVIDQPMTLALRETILFSEQSVLDGLVAQGALVGNPRIAFLPANNSVNDMMQGEFTWNISATPTPQLKTARAIVSYTTEGFNAYITATEGGE